MADCFSLPNAAELVERDAAVEDVSHRCGKCRYEDYPPSKAPCSNCKKRHYDGTSEFTNWEWRGIKEEEDAVN